MISSLRKLRDVLARAFASTEPSAPWYRVERIRALILLGMVAVGLVAGILDAGELGRHHTVFIVILALYLPFVLAGLRRHVVTATARIAGLCIDLLLLFLLQVLVPETRFVVFFGYMLLETYAGAGGGFVAGITVGAAAMSLGILGERLDSIPGFDIFTLVLYSVMLTLNAFLIEAATREQVFRFRRASRVELSSLSHEIKNSIMAIEGFAETLSDRWRELDDQTRATMLERIAANSADLEQLTSNILDAGRHETEWKPRIEPINLERFVQDLVAVQRPTIGDHPVRIEAGGAAVLADGFALARILRNLVSNAAKYSPKGSSIAISGAQDGDAVTVSVSDHGAGIAEADRARLFEAFYRGDGATIAPGTGLGLGVVRKYVEALGGRIWFESRPGFGTTFSFTLPAAESNRRAG